MGGQVILWLRHQAFHNILSCRDITTLLKGLFLSRRKCFCHDNCPIFLPSVLSDDINLCRDLHFCHDISFCRDLVCTCPKFDDKTAFHSLSIRKFETSIKSFPRSNSDIFSIQFSQNLCREKNAPLFQISPSCELLDLS